MREIVKNNKVLYSYNTHKISDGVIMSIILYAVSVLLLIISILISYLYLGEAPSYVAGIGISSIIFNIASMIKIIIEIYFYENFHSEIRTMLILELILFSVWIFIIF
ncbi:MAG: hypothetical protein IJ593_09275 [Lachnospiraceae bacterium]|nr:hypothetical protein [Lachnospiraceae bacterium]